MEVMGNPELNCDQLPKHEHTWQKVDPYQQKVFMKNIEHGMQAMCGGQLGGMSPYPIEQVGVDIDEGDVQPALVLIDVVYLSQVKNCLSFVDS
jgi:hypothetical protein